MSSARPPSLTRSVRAGTDWQTMPALPRAILFDLDDTLLSAYADPERAWHSVLQEFATQLAPLDSARLVNELTAYSNEFWSNPDQHRYWRLRLHEARCQIVGTVFKRLSSEGFSLEDELATAIALRFNQFREEQMFLFPGARETLQTLRDAGVQLALVTNGPSELQRAKITRFDLARYFHHIQIEGEHGFGKPEERAYIHAMQTLAVEAHETWMVGDNLEWEVAAPQRLGIHAIWHDTRARGLPEYSHVRPDRIIRNLHELLDHD